MSESVEIPRKIASKIRNCWVASLFSMAITFIFVVMAFTDSGVDFDAMAFSDVAIMAALTFGVYRGSRVCAVLLFAFFTANKLIMWTTIGTFAGLPLALVFSWFFGQGIMGTFQRHRFLANTTHESGQG